MSYWCKNCGHRLSRENESTTFSNQIWIHKHGHGRSKTRKGIIRYEPKCSCHKPEIDFEKLSVEDQHTILEEKEEGL